MFSRIITSSIPKILVKTRKRTQQYILSFENSCYCHICFQGSINSVIRTNKSGVWLCVICQQVKHTLVKHQQVLFITLLFVVIPID